jgi:cytochrome c oxidase subunit 2
LRRPSFFLIAATLSSALLSGGAAPMNYLSAYGSKADIVLPLTWAVLVIALVVILVILFSVAAGVWTRGRALSATPLSQMPLGGTGSGLNWIYIGVGVTALVLIGTVFWTMSVLARTYLPPSKPRLTIVITGHQWWWEAQYQGRTSSDTFATANEIHIPTGQPVLFELKSGDVIHSFWVPPLNGKTDTIPGQTNFTWLEASKPGIYRGQCTEYCGLQHAHMALLVIAQSPSDFDAWRKHQLQDQPKPGMPHRPRRLPPSSNAAAVAIA